MLKRNKFTTEQLRFAIENRDFQEEVLNSAPFVACIMTQSWCPQWIFMRSWLNQLSDTPTETADMQIQTFEVEYDRCELFSDFRNFKEQIWNNWEVPYVRYYARGRLIHESNFVSAMMFIDNLRMHN